MSKLESNVSLCFMLGGILSAEWCYSQKCINNVDVLASATAPASLCDFSSTIEKVIGYLGTGNAKTLTGWYMLGLVPAAPPPHPQSPYRACPSRSQVSQRKPSTAQLSLPPPSGAAPSRSRWHPYPAVKLPALPLDQPEQPE